MSDERRAEIVAGLAEEVAWAINYLRGIQSEINDLHRDGRLKAWDRSRLHDLIRCVVDGVQGRVGLERALRGEVSTTAERSASALDRVRDARGDDEAGQVSHWECECGQRVKWKLGAWLCPTHRDLAVVHPVARRSPQDEDHEAERLRRGIARIAYRMHLMVGNSDEDIERIIEHIDASVGFPAPKADENQEASQTNERRP